VRRIHCALAAGLFVPVLAGIASGQEQPIASRPWQFGQTAGPNGTDYAPPNDAQDLWIVEDFGIASDAMLTRFESYGTIYPAPLVVTDVTVRIYDDLPTVGHVVLQSVPGTGHIVVSGTNYRLTAGFGSQFLRAGSYYVVWTVETNSGQIAIFWAQDGPPAVGSGGTSDAQQWNPGLGWNWPTGPLRPVPADLQGNGQSGVNFTLYGTPGCYANCDGSTAAPVLNVQDFTCFLQKFSTGAPYANCDGSTAQPVLNVQDFTCFMQKFALGCS
jgi:hypothetical protein